MTINTILPCFPNYWENGLSWLTFTPYRFIYFRYAFVYSPPVYQIGQDWVRMRD